jgi:hypothetical protein
MLSAKDTTLQVSSTGHVAAHVQLKKERVQRPKVVLPFGIPMHRRPRTTRGVDRLKRARGEGPSCRRRDRDQQCRDQDASTSSSSYSTSQSSSTESSSESPELEKSDDLSPPDYSSAIVCPGMVEQEGDIMMEEVAAQSLQPPHVVEVPIPVTSGGTFFNQRVGVLDFNAGSTKSRGRSAMCYHCNRIIERGSTRFSYSYNVKRPWKFLHEHCLVPLVRGLGSEARDQALAFCLDFQSDVNKGVELRDSVSQLSHQLQYEPASASNSLAIHRENIIM